MTKWNSLSIGDIAKQMQICQVLSTTFFFFNQQTGLNPQFIFSCVEGNLQFDISFSPREPSEDEWNFFIQTLLEDEEFVRNKQVLSDIDRFENIAQLKYKLIEDIKIVSKSRRDAYQGEL